MGTIVHEILIGIRKAMADDKIPGIKWPGGQEDARLVVYIECQANIGLACFRLDNFALGDIARNIVYIRAMIKSSKKTQVKTACAKKKKDRQSERRARTTIYSAKKQNSLVLGWKPAHATAGDLT